MQAKTTTDIYDSTGRVVILPAGSIGTVVRVVSDDTYGDDLVIRFAQGEFRIPAEDCIPASC